MKKKKNLPCTMGSVEKAITGSVEKGVVYVVAAGNEDVDAGEYVSPAKHPDVITVSGIADYNGKSGGGSKPVECLEEGADDTSYDWSNWGGSIEIAAPGVCILSTVPGGGYEEFTGTSMATPHVSGAAAILASISNPGNKADVEKIRKTIIEKGNTGWTDTSGDGIKEKLLDVSNETAFNLNG